MAWEERTVKEMREEFVRRVLAKEKSSRLRCAGSTGSAVPQGTNGFSDSKKVSPVRSEPRALKDKLAASHRRWRRASFNCGSNTRRWARKSSVKSWKTEEVRICPVHATFNNIFARHHLITKDASLAATHIQRFEKRSPTTCGRRISKEILLLPTAFAAIR
ncbi:MAG: hypothetical protein ACLVB5_02635 [Christensenellales bacterium]